MKTAIFIFLLAAGCFRFAAAQNVSLPLANDSTITFQQVVIPADTSLTKDQLYSFSKIWFVNTFNNAKNGIQIDDINTGRLVAAGSMPMANVPGYSVENPTLNYTIEVICKKGKYRYKIYNLYLSTIRGTDHTVTSIYSDYRAGKLWRDVFQSQKAAQKKYDAFFIDINYAINALADSLTKSINTQIEKDKF